LATLKFIRMSIVQNLMLKSFVIFCKYVILKVSCLSSVSARSSLVSTFCSKSRSRNDNVLSRLGLEDFGRDSSSADIYYLYLMICLKTDTRCVFSLKNNVYCVYT